MIVALLTAAVTFWLSYDDGAYSLTSRTTFAIGVCWVTIVGVLAGILPAGRTSRLALVPGTLLAALAVFTAASSGWAADAEGVFVEFDRVALYLAVFALAALAAKAATAARVADGLALGISAVCFLALAARLFPSLVSQASVQALLPTEFSRLSYPINYWNALGVMLALAYPLLLRSAVAAAGPLRRGASLAPLPALSAAVYLTSSRGAIAALAAGVIAFLALTRERWAAVEATLVAGVGSLVAFLVLHARSAVVNPPVGGTVPAGQAHTAALLIALICLACGVLYALRVRLLAPLRLPVLAGRLGVVLVVAGAAVAIAASHPVRHFDSFKAYHRTAPSHESVQSHLLSLNGSGRWQFWRAAMDEFRDQPLRGEGAGSFEAWWARHGALDFFIRDAHSLYLEQLGELGIVGFLFLAGAFLSGLGIGVVGVARAPAEQRPLRAALCGSFIAYAVAAGIDWMWEVAAVTAVGIACLGLLAGLGAGRERKGSPSRGRRRLTLVVPVVLVGLALIVGQGIALLSESRLSDSQAAVLRGDTAAALRDARSARDLEPWAARPYLQLALVEEQAQALPEAERRIRQAIAHDRTDWRLWVIAARIQTKRGEIASARRSLAHARELNPRDPALRD